MNENLLKTVPPPNKHVLTGARRWTKAEADEVRALYATGRWSVNALTKKFQSSGGTIKAILDGSHPCLKEG